MSPLFLILPVLLPVLGGFALLLSNISDDRTRNIYSEFLVCLTSVLTWICIFKVNRDPAELYRFTRGFSIELRLDGLGTLFAGMISLMWPLVMLYAFDYMKSTRRKNMFFAFYVMTYGVTLGVAFSSNLTTLYVFFEMLTLVTIPLVSYYEDHDSMYAGRKYAAYTIGGASLGFFTVVLTTVYGNTAYFDYGGSLSPYRPIRLLQIAYLFGFFGFGVKAAVFPLHSWLTTASVAPTPVTALLHAVAVVNSGAFAIMRLNWYTYGPYFLINTGVHTVTFLFSVFTLVFAAVMALRERHFKRRLAYSTISNLSYMLFGVMLLTPYGFEAGMMHMLFHGVIKMSLFLCAGVFMHVTGKSYIYEINGAGRKLPATFVFYTLGALSLTGVPLFCGFISKWNLVTAGLQEGTWMGLLGAAALIVAAFFCAMYTLNISIRAFFPVKGTERFADQKNEESSHLLMLIPIGIFGIANIVLGVCSGPVTAFLQKIAEGHL